MEISSKWIATLASIWIQCSCGASYTFGIYSSVLKSSRGYDQTTLVTISIFKDIGANVGILAGLLYSAITSKHSSNCNSSSSLFGRGLWMVHMVGAIQCFSGYFLMWLSVTGVIQRPPMPVMCFFMFLASHGQNFFNATNVVTVAQNLPDYGGIIVGIMKGFLGLSGAILIQVYQTLLNGNPCTFC